MGSSRHHDDDLDHHSTEDPFISAGTSADHSPPHLNDRSARSGELEWRSAAVLDLRPQPRVTRQLPSGEPELRRRRSVPVLAVDVGGSRLRGEVRRGSRRIRRTVAARRSGDHALQPSGPGSMGWSWLLAPCEHDDNDHDQDDEQECFNADHGQTLPSGVASEST